ncbi:MAG: hypothetical protein JWP15_605 [Alphaproteobacteria bacterium]|nr:hypothetical protein [Alphaproteobacteria bacterium]
MCFRPAGKGMSMEKVQPESWPRRIAPALLLAFLAPVFTEVLPGATRFSSIFVFPIEMAVWGGGAVLIREVVRRRGLGWWSLLLLGLALAIAEECLIQQTSLAPLVIRLKGEEWARAFGVNYVYLLWALVYESVWVVLLSVLTAEMVFPGRRAEGWLSRAGAIATISLFLLGAFLAWFSWTRIARVQVFHQPPFAPPTLAVFAALLGMLILAWAALRVRRSPSASSWRPPPSVLLAAAAAIWAILWYGLVVLAFGIAPRTPSIVVVAGGLGVILILIVLVPRWAAHPGWSRRHDFALVAGALAGSMAVSFVGFIGSSSADLAFKIAADLLAALFLLWLGRRVFRSGAETR